MVMSRLEDIIELIQTTNEVYFITAPGRVRTAFILVDDILEIALKSYLQDKVIALREKCQARFRDLGWVGDNNEGWLDRYFEHKIDVSKLIDELNGKPKPDQAQVEAELKIFDSKMLQHWSANDSKSRKHFPQVIREVKPFFTVSSSSTPHPAIELLDEALIRHDMRNDFYHDHKRSGYTINDDKCLNALCGLFDLMEYLFPGFKDPVTPKNHIPSFTEKVKGNNTVRCQIGVIRLKKAALGGQTELSEPYKVALEQIKKEYVEEDPRSSEQRLVHTVSFNFFNALQKEFVYRINKLRDRINEIDNMKRPNRSHQAEKHNKESLMQILQGQLDQINALLEPP
jgi:hypothetical protein